MNYEAGFSRDPGTTEVYADDHKSGRRVPWWLIIPAIMIAAALAGAYYMFGRDANTLPAGAKTATAAKAVDAAKKDKKEIPHVTVIVPGRTTVPNLITSTGTLAARLEMPVGAVGEGGLVTRVLVDAGDWVRAGQVLAVVDRQVQNEQLTQLTAQISVSEADARLAQSELDRASALVKRGFISKADIDRKTATRDAARARVRVAQAQLSENRARMGRLDIRAPAAGYVLARSVEPGQVVGAGGAVLFRIAKDGLMEMKAQLSEADLAKLAVGYRATVVPVGTTTEFAGQIWQLAPVIDPQSRQGTARVALPFNRGLRPGGFASVRISGGSVEAPLLSESAVQSDPKGNYVYIVGPDNKVARRDVRVGNVTDAGVSIIEGLAGTEKVVLSAGGFLNPGEIVAPDIKLTR